MDVSVDARTRVAALFGHPVEHSLSPLIHNTAFRALQLNFVYVALDVLPEDIARAVTALGALRFVGANVTAPHKQAVIPALDDISEQARAVGAVNAIACRTDERSGKRELFGDNTDVAGFLAPLSRYASGLPGKRMVILGAGGAARAVAYALLTTFKPERLTLAARAPDRAEAIASDLSLFGESLVVRPLDRCRADIRESALIVNATPVGTFPHVAATPWEEIHELSPDQIVYDLVYNPEQTRLLRDASLRGATTIGGLEMLIAQAAVAFEMWTGKQMPVDTVREALRQQNAKR